jgi:hypothetical protein
MGRKRIPGVWQVSDIEPIPDMKEFALLPNNSCIYFLSEADEIVYIGQSINLMNRINTHRSSMSFDRVHYLNIHGQDTRWLTTIEGAFIKRVKPVLNMTGKTTELTEVQNEYLRKYVGDLRFSNSLAWSKT